MDIIRMMTDMSSPDSLRQLLQLSKKFYDLHTKKYFGYEDNDGLQYAGTAENFGSELLLETRKLRMNKPPVKFINPNSLFEYYFDISHSDFIESYPQQNLLMGCVKRDVLLSNHTYQLKFTNTSFRKYVRSEAYSDQLQRTSAFRMTMDNPILIIDDVEYELYVGSSDNSDEHVTWYFAINATTDDKYTLDGDTILITDLKQFIDLPVVWLCMKDMRMLPDMKWYDGIDPGNLDWKGRPLIEFGVNGNDTILLYPYLYGESNFPLPHTAEPFDPDTGYWYVKVYGEFETVNALSNYNEYNMNAKITRIGYVHCLTESFTDEPDFEYYFTYDDKYSKVSLTNIGYQDGLAWTFRKPVDGDYDYDASGVYNPIYACIPLQPFKDVNVQQNGNFLPLFKVSFDDKYFHPYESDINAMDTGIHLDITTDFSDHAVSKRFGVIHDLCEFDGLPPYYKYYMDRTIHHAHAEIYAIRDDANVRNQHAMDKQTAALIIDSSVPINDYETITSDMKPVIVYEGPHTFKYITKEENIVSDVNYLSDIGFIDHNHFGDVTIQGLPYTHKFVYHGNRHFSTGIIQVDPDMEYGRVYAISNDGIGYENNMTCKNTKAPRTLARSCDIPTSFTQLQNIPNLSPTLIVDPDYIRSSASFNEDEYLTLWNLCSDWFVPKLQTSLLWCSSPYILNAYFGSLSTVINKSGDVEIPQRTIALSDCTIHITNGGSGYAVDDTFGFNIGGLFLKGVVNSVTGTSIDQTDSSFSLYVNDSIPDQPSSLTGIEIPLANFSSSINVYPLNTLTGNGSGAKISVTVDYHIWEQRITGIRTLFNPNTFALVHEPMGRGICFIQYDPTSDIEHGVYPHWDENNLIQLTGDLSSGNPAYENALTASRRTELNVFLYNMLTNRNVEDDFLLEYTSGKKTIDFASKECQFSYPDITIESLVIDRDDLSDVLSSHGMNQWNSFIAAVPTRDRSKYYTLAWSYDMNASFVSAKFGNGNLLFPKFTGLNIGSYDNSWSSIKFNIGSDNKVYPFMYDIMHTTYDSYNLDKGDLCISGRSIISLQSILPTKNIGYPEDAEVLYSGNKLNYNLYRFDHLNRFYYLDRMRAMFSDFSEDRLYSYILNQYGLDSDIRRLYSYNERPYEVDQTYNADELISYQELVTVPYEENVTYAGGVVLVDSERNMYRAEHPFVSTTLENDIANHNITFIGVKPTSQTASTYMSTQRFTATDIQTDVSNGNLKYIGQSVKFNTMLNYIMTRTYDGDHLFDNDDLALYLSADDSLKIPENQPIGGFVPLVDTVNQSVTVNNLHANVDPLYIFRIDEPISDLDNFRMYDGDIDISEYTMLIIKMNSGYQKYMFHNDKWEFVYS